MEKVEIKMTEGYEVLDSGSVIAIPGIPLSFVIEGLEFVFQFENDADNNMKQHANAIAVSDKKLLLTLYNYNNSLGIGNTSLLPMGKLQGRELLMSYRIYALNPEMGKLFFYTFYTRPINN